MPNFNSPYSSPRSRARSISRSRVPPLPTNHSPPPMLPYSNGIDTRSNSNHSDSHGYSSDVAQLSCGSPPRYPPTVPHHHQNYYPEQDADYDPDSDTEFTIYNPYPDSPPNFNHNPPSDPSGSSSTTLAQSPFEALKARLLPLRHIEALLIAKLVPPNEDEATHFATLNNDNGRLPSPTASHFYARNGRLNGRSGSLSYRNQEIFVRPGHGWKGGLAKARVNFSGHSYGLSSSQANNGHRPMSAGNTGLETPDEPQEILHSCRRDMMQLWNDEGIRHVLRRRKIRLEEGSGL